MKLQIKELSSKLKDVHKRFLEKERFAAEEYYQKKISPFEFLLMLTQDKNFSWIQPFSALIAEIDAFVDESSEVTEADLKCIRDQVDFLTKSSNETLTGRYQHHLNTDADFILLHSSLKKALSEFIDRK